MFLMMVISMRMFIFEERVCQPAPWWRGRCPRRSRRSHLHRSFASLSIAPGHHHEDDSIDDIDNDDDDSDDYHDNYDDWNDQDLDDVPRLQEILTRLMAGHIQAEAGESFFVEIFDGCYSALGHYWSFKYELAVPLFVFVSISAKCSCSRSSSERVWKEAH